ncbi:MULTISPECIES: CDP-glycerol glycerophosphotransferase family protein [Virgibacillus]|uniref:Putative CDP-glycerol:glycerophosphate glycerophosphotransferase n=1 Tax=Virgibacillus massiliensis TaxID=1462526 RepID=A0A024Q820_9BACI|nr:CDP-glycerol glycerophosphotransferase family protein [Virgibacillus massiliensis]CDQ38355.1 Putative CDP-glycerol:glycerophosphate glycerophosphotransferase [Virgibacillus massiliensis]
MNRELLITFYLIIFRIVFNLFQFFPIRKKTTMIASLGHNIRFTAEALEKHTDESIIILKTKRCQLEFRSTDRRTIIPFNANHPFDWLRSIYHLATSHVIFADNYYGILAVTNFRHRVRVVQLWHAAGAIKKFGLQDPSNKYRSKKAIARFQKVYQRFTDVVIGSEKMASIFKRSFHISDNRLRRTGIPRTDFFYQTDHIRQVKNELQHSIGYDQTKKIILYAPTFRNMPKADVQLNIKQLYDHLKHEYLLFLSIHPSEQITATNRYPDFVFDVSHFSMNHILTITEILITDYSSIPFEFAFFQRPMIFFAYDLEDYKQERGMWQEYENLVPGPIVKTTEAIIHLIRANRFNLNHMPDFHKEWNTYSDGHASNRLIKTIYHL